MNDYPKAILIGTWLVFGVFFVAGSLSLSYFIYDYFQESKTYRPEVQAIMEQLSDNTDSVGYKLAWFLSSVAGVLCIIPVILQTKAYRMSVQSNQSQSKA